MTFHRPCWPVPANNSPGESFWELAITEIDAESVFDGACSFSSLLYLDPIDLFHSIHRLYHAIKPGGLLFLYAYDLHPGWRGQPYHVDINHWMWGETYSMDEAACALEEHGYFKVLRMLDTTTEAQKKQRIELWRIQTQKEHEELVKNFLLITKLHLRIYLSRLLGWPTITLLSPKKSFNLDKSELVF